MKRIYVPAAIATALGVVLSLSLASSMLCLRRDLPALPCYRP